MPALPQRPDLDQLRHRAKDLLRAARNGDAEATARIHQVSDRLILAAAQLAIAREHGFAGWARLKTEVERRDILNSRDLTRLAALLAEQPDQATSELRHWCDHPGGASPLGYMAMLRFDARRLGLTGDLPGTGAMAQSLIDAGAAVNGDTDDPETPLMTAASYGDAEVAAVLVANGADLEATASPAAGGVPGGTALLHAAVFGMTGVVDVLVAAGAEVRSIEEAAAAGDVTGLLTPGTSLQARIRALIMAADHQRLEVIDQLVHADTPIDADDSAYGRQALRLAAQNGRGAAVQRLLELGADPGLRDPEHHLTALEWCRLGDSPGHRRVEAILRPVTPP